MSKLKSPIIIANWKSNLKNLDEAKNLLKKIEKEYVNIVKKNKKKKVIKKVAKKSKSKKKSAKKENIKVDMNFLLSLPSPFIYPIDTFLKEKNNKNLNKILIGAQNFDEIEKTNKNNSISLTQIKSVGAKFVILNNADEILSEDIEFSEENLDTAIQEEKEEREIKKDDDKNKKVAKYKSTNAILLERLNKVSKKVLEKGEEETLEEDINIQIQNKNLLDLEEKIIASLSNGVFTILFVRDAGYDDFRILTGIVKSVIKNIHYNLFDKLIICYEPDKNLHLDQVDISNCLEKTIAIRRTVANMFGIDNAKKIKIIFSGKINENNVEEIMKNGGIDGVLVNEESLIPETFAKIMYKVSS